MNSHDAMTCIDPRLGAKLLSYGTGQLGESDRQEFEEHLLLCSACQAELKAADHVLKAIAGGRGELVEKLRGRHESSREVKESKRQLLWPVMAAAACLIGIVYWAGLTERAQIPVASDHDTVDTARIVSESADTSAQLVTSDSARVESAQLRMDFAQLATKLPLAYVSVNLRGVGETSRKEFERAMQFYGDKDYRAASAELRTLLLTDSMNTELLLYLGISYYMTGSVQECIEVLSRAEKLKPRTTRVAQVRWYRANAELLVGNLERAKADLLLVKQSEADLSDDAASLLKRLEGDSP